jgi:hypothetical protein
MLLWEYQYRNEIKLGYKINDFHNKNCRLVKFEKTDIDHIVNEVTIKNLGERYIMKQRSLKKNKGCTLDDMEKLIGEVLRFGAGIPDCELRNEEQRGFDKYYGVKE